MVIINYFLIIRRLLRNGRKNWDHFCEYTELPGFRFMTSKVTSIVRISAITTFIFCLIGMCAQLYYLIIQYLLNQIQTSSKKYRIQHMALPLVYLCHQLDRKNYSLPLVDICRESVFVHGSPDLANNELMRNVVPYCIYSLKLIDYKCELRCKWTSQGFCIETRLNHTSLDKTLTRNYTENEVDFSRVTDYEIKIYFNSSIQPDAAPNTFALALVFLRFAGDAIKWPTIIPLVGAAHMIMERDALNILQVIEILKITRNDLPNSQLAPLNSSYEYCVWRTNSELIINEGWKCPSEFITNLFARKPSDFENVNYGLSKCALERALAAQKRCREDKEFNRFTVESAIYTRSAAESDGLDPRNSPNLRVYPSDVAMQETLHQLRSAEWKMMSEVGGTLALYLGFTLMGLLEAIVFLTVEHVRKVARQLDEEGQLARKNPPIKKLFNKKMIKQFFTRKK